jgi:DNA-binding response OmpR family regulator
MKQILIVEDDKSLSNGIKIVFQKDYRCVQAFSLQTARKLFQEDKPNLILLDVNLPDGSGIDFLTEVRMKESLPVILLTANKMEMDIVTGLELGANDYITKPFSLMILRARVGVQLREEKMFTGVYQTDEFDFDFNKMEFRIGGNHFEMSKTEQRLLRYLIENKGRNVSRSQLIDYIWQGDHEFVDEHALTVVINRLRTKLGDSPQHPSCIKTVYGIGYTWIKEI